MFLQIHLRLRLCSAQRSFKKLKRYISASTELLNLKFHEGSAKENLLSLKEDTAASCKFCKTSEILLKQQHIGTKISTNSMKMLQWPSRSPDFNLTKVLWDDIKRAVHK